MKMIGYKKCMAKTPHDVEIGGRFRGKEVIVKLAIPSRAKIVYPNQFQCNPQRKHRASSARVLDIRFKNGKKVDPNKYRVFSFHNTCFEYKLDVVVKPNDGFNNRQWEVCASGIHFFDNRKAAADFQY